MEAYLQKNVASADLIITAFLLTFIIPISLQP